MLPIWLIRMRASPVANLVAAAGNCSMMVCTCPRNEYVPKASAPITLAITMTVPATRGILIASSHATSGFSV